jgi:ParB-like chromosome segregation protein Spo0J
MEVVQIAVDRLMPNSWNVNRMSAAMQNKLAAYLKREGLVEPIVVRPHPKDADSYEILGGFHRWTICREHLGYETVPCVVVEGLDDRRAKILSVNLNSMKGESVPSLLSNLLHDLEQEMPLADMEMTLPYEAGEIVDFLSLMQLPDDFADALEDEARAVDEAAPTVITLVLDRKQSALWNEAVEAAKAEVGGSRNPKARTLELISSHYVASRRGAKAGVADE